MRVAIYTRISKDKTGLEAGVDRQLSACTALAAELGWTVVEEFSDNDISAYSGRVRPDFERLLDTMKRGQVDALICWHTDRLYRTLKDLARLLDVAKGVEIRTVQGGDIDLSNASGRMIATILGSVSMNESEHHAERRREANLARAKAGAWCATGIRPFGYDKHGVPLEPEASLIRQAAKDVIAGKSLHSVARGWNDAGHTTVKGAAWTNLHVRRVLRNPRIAALRVHQGTVIGPGDWEAILDETTWTRLTAILHDPTRAKAAAFTRRYLGSGVYRCGICGNPLYASHPHGKDKPMVYACRPTVHLVRSGAKLDEMVEMVVLGHLATQGIGGAAPQENESLAELHEQRRALVEQKDQLGSLFGRHVIDITQLENGTVELKGQIAEIDRRLAESTRISPAVLLLGDGDDETASLVDLWEAASPDTRSRIVAALMTVTVMPAPKGVRTFDPSLIQIDWR